MPDKTKKIIIAIDGYSSSGKSTLAKQIAQALGYIFVDTGAMYRAVTLYFKLNNINIFGDQEIQNALKHIDIKFKYLNGKNVCFLNGENVEDQIRTLNVSRYVSEVSAISAVRSFLVEQQREMGLNKALVMDGRDIGTVVFPDAEVKFFITAERRVRADRRYKELRNKKQNVDLEEILTNIKHRDTTDTQRADSPLKKAEDAILIDNTLLTPEEQFDLAMDYINKATHT